VVRGVAAPVNVVVGLSGAGLGVAQLQDAGVKRISIGGSLARATFGIIREAAEEMLRRGTFTFAGRQIADAELCGLFGRRINRAAGDERV